MRNIKAWVAALAAFVIAIGWSYEAECQTFVRPSKGATIQLANDSTLSPTVGGTLYDWTAFDGVQIVVTASATISTCSSVPEITAYGKASTSGSNVKLLGGHIQPSSAISENTFTATLMVPTPYFRIYASVDAGAGATACTFDVFVTPIVFTNSISAPYHVSSSDWGRTLVNDTATKFSRLEQTTHFTIQNNDTATVYCGFDSTVSTTDYAVALKSATAQDDGTGGSWTLSDYRGDIWCISGTDNQFVSISFW